MIKETTKALTKIEYREVFVAARSAFNRYSQGGAEVARMLDMSPNNFLDQFNPNEFDHAPTLYTFLRTVDYLQDREMADTIASLANCCAIPTRSSNQAAGLGFEALSKRLVEDVKKAARSAVAYRSRPSTSNAVSVRESMFCLIDTAHALILATQAPHPNQQTKRAVSDSFTDRSQNKHNTSPVSGSSHNPLRYGYEERGNSGVGEG